MRVGLLALYLTACGRFAFEPHAPDAPPPPDTTAPGATADDFVAALSCETDVPIATVPAIDELRWLDLGGTQVVFAVHHVDNTHHEIHAHVLGVNAGQIVKVDDVTSYAANDLTGLVVTTTPAGYGIVINDAYNSNIHALQLDAHFALAADTVLPGLRAASHSYARSTAAGLVVGTTASAVGAYVVDASLAPTSMLLPIANASDTPQEPSVAPLGADFIVAWAAYAQGTCKYARVTSDGAVMAPLAVPITGGNCRVPSAVAVGAGIVAGFHEATYPTAYAATFDGALTTTTPPVAIGANDSQIQTLVGDTSRALAIVRTTGDSRVVAVAPDGTTQMLGADFGLSGTDIDHETAALVAGALLHVRSEGGMLRLRKLCR